jgi:hypothetical protein
MGIHYLVISLVGLEVVTRFGEAVMLVVAVVRYQSSPVDLLHLKKTHPLRQTEVLELLIMMARVLEVLVELCGYKQHPF